MLRKVIVMMFGLLGISAPLQAAGFLQSELAASAAGVGNAFVATADDVAAAIYNPSGKAWQDGWDLSMGYIVDYRDSSVRLPAGVAPNNGSEPNMFYFYGGWMPLDSSLGITFAYAPMYHIQNDWGLVFGAAAGNTSLRVDDIAMDAVYAVNSSLAVSLGADWYLSDVTMVQGGVTFKDRDLTSFGGHASLLWKPAPGWSLGVNARSGASINMSSGNQKMTIKLPDQIQAGLAYLIADRWRLEGDVQWVRWSSIGDMNVTSGGTVVMANPLNLRDTISAMAGLTWTLRENTQVRLGYAYEQGAQKRQGFNPLISDQDGHRVSLGGGGEAFGLHLDAVYSYTFYPKKTVSGPYAGTYRDRRQMLALSMSKHF